MSLTFHSLGDPAHGYARPDQSKKNQDIEVLGANSHCSSVVMSRPSLWSQSGIALAWIHRDVGAIFGTDGFF